MHDTRPGAERRTKTADRPHLRVPSDPVATPTHESVVPASATGVITIDLAKVRTNWQVLARNVAPAECGAVVKADAYGLGAARIIPALLCAGCRSFFVATPEEAAAVRELAPEAAIYVLDGLLAGTELQLAWTGAIPVLANLDELRAWAASADAPAPTALHVDTGLNRLGMSPDALDELVRDTALLERLDLQLVMSHLACADEPAHPMNREQLETFNRLRARLPATRASLAASDGLMLGPEFHFDLVRPGYALYGGHAVPGHTAPVEPVVRVSARILQVADVMPGARIGYSASYRANEPRRIATIAAGYADGVFRHASATNETPGGAVLIRGHRAPIVGRVSMDLITVDVTGISGPAPQRGDWVDLIGPELPIEDVGAAAGTIGYEVLTRLGPRFHRIYLDD